jgi:glutamine amidotransferase
MIGIVDYGLGNLHSVAGAVERLEAEPVISDDPIVLADCNKLILPGVGAFGDGMANLRARGLDDALEELVVHGGRPILGICLGAQLLTRSSVEFGEYEGLGWLDAQVVRLEPTNPELRVPHIGWDDIELLGDSFLFDGARENPLFYYVHSFCIETDDPGIVIGECEYGQRFAAALARDNIFAVQFHPEKSQEQGLTVLGNFLRH